MNSRNIQEVGALGMVAVSLCVVGWLAILGNEAAMGAMISVVSAGVGFFLRGRVEAGRQ
jgi:hypothetical protein